MSIELKLTISRGTKAVPYPPAKRDHGHQDDQGFILVKGDPSAIGRISEAQDSAAFRQAIEALNGTESRYFYLVWDELDLLHRMLERRIQHVGQWRMASAAGSAVAEQLASTCPTGGQLAARVDLLDDFCRLWNEGRGRPVDRDILDASGAVTATFFERVVEVAAELEGDANALVEAMRSRQDERLSGYRTQAADKLEAFLVDEGHIDRRPVRDENEICACVMASPAAARLPGDLAAECVHRWWTLSET